MKIARVVNTERGPVLSLMFDNDAFLKLAGSDDRYDTVLRTITSGGSDHDIWRALDGTWPLMEALALHEPGSELLARTPTGELVWSPAAAGQTPLLRQASALLSRGASPRPVERMVLSALSNRWGARGTDAVARWLSGHRVELLADGRLTAYKSLTGSMTSMTAGPGTTTPRGGQPTDVLCDVLDNSVGNTVSVEASLIDRLDADCGTGLHVLGEPLFGYCGGTRMAVVAFEARDMATSSTDKARVCRYKVLREILPEQVDGGTTDAG